MLLPPHVIFTVNLTKNNGGFQKGNISIKLALLLNTFDACSLKIIIIVIGIVFSVATVLVKQIEEQIEILFNFSANIF